MDSEKFTVYFFCACTVVCIIAVAIAIVAG